MPAASAILQPRRYLALWFPFLPTDRLRQTARFVWQDEPLLLVARAHNAILVQAACPHAQALGLMPGLALADARARVPNARVQAADPNADAQLLLQLATHAGRWSPMVAVDPPDGLLIDISGCAHLFGGEAALAADVADRLGQMAQVRHGFASTPAAAHALARHPQDGASEAHAIRSLPVAALRLAPRDEAAMHRAGLTQIADLVDRPTAPLSARFGQDATRALDQLIGRADSRITPLRPMAELLFTRRFAEPIALADSVRAALFSLVVQAAAEMERRAQGGRCFVVSLFRTDGILRALAIETGQPTRDPALVGRLFEERIAALADPLDPGFGFDCIQLTVPAIETLAAAQPDLHDRQLSHEALDAMLARLAARHGRSRIRRFVPIDTHVPEHAERMVPALDQASACKWPMPAAGEPPLRPLFLFDPPQPVEALAEVPDAPPKQFRWNGVAHLIVRAEGPERIAAPWWKKSGEGRPTRDYYCVEDKDGRRFWLFRRGLYGRELETPCWFIHGLFA